MSLKPINEKLEDFFDYILENYIEKDCLFPPTMWAEYISSIERTTNCCESFHTKFNSCFYSANPNIFQFIDVLKEVQIGTYVKLRSTNKLQNLKSKNKETFIKIEMYKYKSNEITKLEFIKNIVLSLYKMGRKIENAFSWEPIRNNPGINSDIPFVTTPEPIRIHRSIFGHTLMNNPQQIISIELHIFENSALYLLENHIVSYYARQDIKFYRDHVLYIFLNDCCLLFNNKKNVLWKPIFKGENDKFISTASGYMTPRR
ncbi:hypothetical protein AGLY_002158 [Aphis glycines]|uniref:Uncharacterized protein n=1 Tax=Aphis glycines TaxID=307491 RepID=A0A6G0U2L7_APHGL|nr:hypothetical protein AGLY_002158 [Aphis glycines]